VGLLATVEPALRGLAREQPAATAPRASAPRASTFRREAVTVAMFPSRPPAAKLAAGRWNRPHASDGTQLVDDQGKPVALAPGGAWFVLVDIGTPFTR
jgi:hypothetical protein